MHCSFVFSTRDNLTPYTGCKLYQTHPNRLAWQAWLKGGTQQAGPHLPGPLPRIQQRGCQLPHVHGRAGPAQNMLEFTLAFTCLGKRESASKATWQPAARLARLACGRCRRYSGAAPSNHCPVFKLTQIPHRLRDRVEAEFQSLPSDWERWVPALGWWAKTAIPAIS